MTADEPRFPRPALPEDATPFERLVAVVAHLRGEPGCPWDKEQDERSLLPYMESECREVAEAVRSGDDSGLEEELGDLLFNVVFMTQVAHERGAFGMDDVVERIIEKLIRRHPHVFEHPRHVSMEEVRTQWDRIKAAEKGLDPPPSHGVS
jgi:MazG family protein